MDRAAAVVHFAGMPAVRSAARHRQPHGLDFLAYIAPRPLRAGSALRSCAGSPEPDQQPSQQHMNSNKGRLTTDVEADTCIEQSESIKREPMQPLASAAAGRASTAVSSPHGEAWTLGHIGTMPRRLPPLTLSRQGKASPTTLLSGDWVSCLCAACTAWQVVWSFVQMAISAADLHPYAEQPASSGGAGRCLCSLAQPAVERAALVTPSQHHTCNPASHTMPLTGKLWHSCNKS